MGEPAVVLTELHKHFGDFHAVRGIDLALRQGEFLTLLGPSGCGKTTTLNMIAGFLQADAGSIYLAGKPVDDLPPFRRDIGLVFQDYALFPHMTVAENIAFGLRMRKVDKQERARRVQEALELVKLHGLGDRKPAALSGGQRQRVALARALVIRPAVLLLDEPLSNLDLKLREEMRLEITSLQHRLGITTILVTHDQGEALTVSDRVAVMYRGAVEQIGTPGEIYEQPRSRFVAEFIGTNNFIAGEARTTVAPGSTTQIATRYGNALCVAPGGTQAGQKLVIGVRPERLHVSDAPVTDGSLSIAGTVEQLVYFGNKVELYVRSVSGEMLVLEQANDGRTRLRQAGEPVHLVASLGDLCGFAET
jgi:spermidine/putrescine ABC transporter ATP-binding subunit